MKRKSEVVTVIKTAEREDSGLNLSYTLTKSEGNGVSPFGLPQYSIKVELTDKEGRRSEASARDVFVDVGRALVFFDRMVKNRATPIDLAYVVEDELR